MAHACNHNHNHNHADIWTKMSVVGGSLTGCIKNIFWTARAINIVAGTDGSEVLSVSWLAMGLGLGLGALATAAGAYSHFILNKNHQLPNDKKENNGIKVGKDEGCSHHRSTASTYQTFETKNVKGERDPEHKDFVVATITRDTGEAVNEETVEEENSSLIGSTNQPKKLTIGQRASLVGDRYCHMVEIAAPICFVADIASGNSLSRVASGLVYGGSALFGAVVSEAAVRTCRHNMERSA